MLAESSLLNFTWLLYWIPVEQHMYIYNISIFWAMTSFRKGRVHYNQNWYCKTLLWTLQATAVHFPNNLEMYITHVKNDRMIRENKISM